MLNWKNTRSHFAKRRQHNINAASDVIVTGPIKE